MFGFHYSPMKNANAVRLLALVLLTGSLVQGQNASKKDPPAVAGSSSTAILADCPAELILAVLKDVRSSSTQKGALVSSANQAGTAGFQWPPPALKQGLSCTMELSQLAIAMPGTNRVCTVLSITNNLLSILYSWQLVWQPASQELAATSASGAVLLNATGLDNTVQLINPPSSTEIAAQGGSADVLVQLAITPPAPKPSSKNSNSSGQGVTQRSAGGSIRPAVESVYLNGLQCTRLPLARPKLTVMGQPDNMNLDDCGTAAWPLGVNGTLGALDQDSLDSLFALQGLNLSSFQGNRSNISNGSVSVLDGVNVSAVLTALRQLACVSQLCCGLQVVPSSVVSISNGSVNSTEPPVLAADGPAQNTSGDANSTQVDAAPLTTDITPLADPGTQPAGSSSSSITGLVVGLSIAGVLAGGIGGLLVVLLRHRHNTRRRAAELLKQQQQAAVQQGLVRHGSGGSSNGSGGASLASIASAEWRQQQQQQQQYAVALSSSRPPGPWLSGGRPYVLPTQHTAPSHLITAATAAATSEMQAGSVWRAGSWQGPDAYTPAGVQQLERSSSNPQPLLRTATASTGTSHPTGPASILANSSGPNTPSTLLQRASSTGPQYGMPQTSPRLQAHLQAQLQADIGPATGSGYVAHTAGAIQSAVARTASGSPGVPRPNVPRPDVLSASSSPRDVLAFSASGAASGSTWGSLRGTLGNNRLPGPKSSTIASSSSVGLMQRAHSTGEALTASLHTLPPHAPPAASHRDHPVQHLGSSHTMATYRPPLQLIQEAAPLSAPHGSALSSHTLSQQQLQLLAAGGPMQLSMMSGQPGSSSQQMATVSRRISPILSVHEDASSATSTDSMNPAAWQFSDRQMLEDTPGWLNIDFSKEVRLEKKLGEGGFGQVFRARWRDKVVAAKLVPFMSLVAQQHHSMSVSLVSADAAAAATGQPPPGHLAAGASGSDASQLSSMRLGVQFSSASLRAIKVEIRVLAQLSHPNIVAFVGACMAPPHICILEELAEGGSLYSRLYSRSSAIKAQQQRQRQQQADPTNATSNSSSASTSPQPRPRTGRAGSSRPPPLAVEEVLRIAVDVSKAMVYLHTLQPQVVHRDLKPQNVLLDLEGRAKVCDFGISKMKDASLAASSTRLQAGTPAYMAPEQFEGCSVTDKVDVFAFGVMLWECFEQQQPWKELSPMQIIYSVGLQKERLQRAARCPDQLWQLIERCWAQDPQDRPSFGDILAELWQQQQQQQLKQSQPTQPQQQQQVDTADCQAMSPQQPQTSDPQQQVQQQQQQAHVASPAVQLQQDQLCAGDISTVVHSEAQSAASKHHTVANHTAELELQGSRDEDVDADVAVIY